MKNQTLTDATSNQYSIRLINLEDLMQAIDLVNNLVEQYSIPEDVAYAIQLVVDEIYVNFCSYGKEAGNSYQDIDFIIIGKSIEIVFKDNGKEFDLVAHPDVSHLLDTPLEDRQIGGLGIHLVKHYADALDYKYSDGYNVLKFKKTW